MPALALGLAAVQFGLGFGPVLWNVTRTALQNAASIGALILTTEAIVSDKPEKAAPAPAGGGDMGGMGGMDF